MDGSFEELRKYAHAGTHAHKHTHTHTYIHTYTHTYTHTYIHTYAHTYIHTHIHTHSLNMDPLITTPALFNAVKAGRVDQLKRFVLVSAVCMCVYVCV